MVGQTVYHLVVAIYFCNKLAAKSKSVYSRRPLTFINLTQISLIYLLFFLFLSTSIYSQQNDLQVETFLVEEGMPTNVQSILQDRTGFLWFTTWSGLYKYDGYEFKSYKHEVDDTTSIIDNNLSVLCEDKEGILWIGSYLGLEKFDRTTNTFTHYTPNPSAKDRYQSNSIWTICEDRFGKLWVGTGDGLYTFNRTNEKFTSLGHDITDPGSISDNQIGVIHHSKDGSLWLGTQVGLDKLDYRTNKFIHFWNDPGIRNELWSVDSKFRINKIFEDESGIMWLGTSGGLVEFNPKAGTFFHYLFNPKDQTNLITSISQDVMTGSLWIASWGGLFSFDKNSKNSQGITLKQIVC